MSVSIVVQRFRKCRLLIDELKYVTVGGGGDDSGCGLLAYVSFASTATPSQVEQAARTLLNLPILTTGLWGDDGSSTMSVIALAAEPTSSASLVVVPQANMISKVKKDGKSIQYHGQIDKEKGRELSNTSALGTHCWKRNARPDHTSFPGGTRKGGHIFSKSTKISRHPHVNRIDCFEMNRNTANGMRGDFQSKMLRDKI